MRNSTSQLPALAAFRPPNVMEYGLDFGHPGVYQSFWWAQFNALHMALSPVHFLMPVFIHIFFKSLNAPPLRGVICRSGGYLDICIFPFSLALALHSVFYELADPRGPPLPHHDLVILVFFPSISNLIS